MVHKQDELEDLAQRIRQAKSESRTEDAKADVLVRSGNPGSGFAGSVLGAGILGFIMDRAFGTMPWCLVGMIVAGFAVGLMNVWRSLTRNDGADQ